MCGMVATQIHGGDGGNAFSDDLTQYCQLVGINIRHGAVVDSVQGIYLLPSGAEVTGPKHGGDGGSADHLKFDVGEHITRIEGRAGSLVDSLKFITNKGQSYGPYGGDGGNAFFIDNVEVHGFVGRAGSDLDAIGFFTPGKCPKTATELQAIKAKHIA